MDLKAPWIASSLLLAGALGLSATEANAAGSGSGTVGSVQINYSVGDAQFDGPGCAELRWSVDYSGLPPARGFGDGLEVSLYTYVPDVPVAGADIASMWIGPNSPTPGCPQVRTLAVARCSIE